jgi:excisionase family DNA binding protein
MSKTYTVKEVATILGYSTNSIYTFLKEKRIKGVRVGKGRFRISEDELGRLLHLSKQTQNSVQTSFVQPAAPAGEVVYVEEPRLTHSATPIIGKSWSMPNVFDWMISLGSILSGVALFLFNQSFEPAMAAQFESVIPFVRGILIASGIGLFVSSISPKSAALRTFFQIVLGVVISFNAWMLFNGGDLSGSILFGLVALTLFVSVFAKLDGVMSVSYYLSAFVVSVPFMFFTSK